MRSVIILSICMLLQLAARAQKNDLPDRKDFDLTLAVDNSNFYQAHIDAGPYVAPNKMIQLYPGETIYAELEFDHDTLKTIKTVKQNLNPAKTVEISFTQQKTGKKHEQMMLKLINPFDKKLEYKAYIYPLVAGKFVQTSVLPVMGKLSGYETWPDVIITMGLVDWRLK